MTQAEKIRAFLDGCAGSAECDAAYAALAELEEIAKWAADARCHLEEMVLRCRRNKDTYGAMETAARVVRHPECVKRCSYSIGLRCCYHQLAGGECRTETP